MYGKKPKNLAGMMGAESNQVIKGMSFSRNVNPLERVMQKSAGKNQSKFNLIKKKKKTLLG
tara:strand:+ start:4509 stop:4691 length:183 start_codon:yes stop_codon:yes gene_type:complete